MPTGKEDQFQLRVLDEISQLEVPPCGTGPIPTKFKWAGRTSDTWIVLAVLPVTVKVRV